MVFFKFDTVNVSAIIAVLSVIVTLKLFKLSALRSVRPVLAFVNHDLNKWQLTNCGTGPAVNILVIDKDRTTDAYTAVQCPPLKAGDSYPLEWPRLGMILVAEYEDIDGRCYRSTCSDWLHRFRTIRHISQPTDSLVYLCLDPTNNLEGKMTSKDIIDKTPEDLQDERYKLMASYGWESRDKKRNEEYSKYSPGGLFISNFEDLQDKMTAKDNYNHRYLMFHQRRKEREAEQKLSKSGLKIFKNYIEKLFKI